MADSEHTSENHVSNENGDHVTNDNCDHVINTSCVMRSQVPDGGYGWVIVLPHSCCKV